MIGRPIHCSNFFLDDFYHDKFSHAEEVPRVACRSRLYTTASMRCVLRCKLYNGQCFTALCQRQTSRNPKRYSILAYMTTATVSNKSYLLLQVVLAEVLACRWYASPWRKQALFAASAVVSLGVTWLLAIAFPCLTAGFRYAACLPKQADIVIAKVCVTSKHLWTL